MNITRIIMLFSLAMIIGCQSKPTVVKSQKNSKPSSEVNQVLQNTHNEHHSVIVNEVLQANKYTYAKVSENGEEYWIAAPKQEIEKGGTYHYDGGLKKINFESREFDRVFPTIILVSSFSKANQSPSENVIEETFASIENKAPDAPLTPVEGGVALDELFTNKEKYNGKKVTVKGKCVKVNNQIMGRNWVHIQDGTKKNGENYDLTITTQEVIQVDMTVTMEGTITLDKDFGAGYRYDIIMESGVKK